MFRVSIKNQEQIETNAAQFNTQEECEAWVKDNHDYFTEGYKAKIVDVTALLVQEKEKAEAKEYLNETDWFVIRKQETGVEVPQEITEKRAAARLKA